MAHIPVLLNECVDNLNIIPGGVYADGTLGGAGHGLEIVKRMQTGVFIGIDRDGAAIGHAREKFKDFSVQTRLVQGNFADIKQILLPREQTGWRVPQRRSTDGYPPDLNKINGMILDLGVSSFQLDDAARGFSYMADGPLDMRMDQNASATAADIVNTYSVDALTRIITDYGEEKWAKRIALFIAAEREQKPLETTFQLVSVIKKAIPKNARKDGPHPAKRTFQAIRIELNAELALLRKAIFDIADVLETDGILEVITFHSLEDRIVKDAFKQLAAGCDCPREFPVCVCGKKPAVKILTKKPILPRDSEVSQNPRARSAKLRIIRKI